MIFIYKYEFSVAMKDGQGNFHEKRFWMERLTENERDIIRLSEESSPDSEAWACLHEFGVETLKVEICARMIYMSIYGTTDPTEKELDVIMGMIKVMLD